MRAETETVKIESGFDSIYWHIDYDPVSRDILSIHPSQPQKFRDSEVGVLLEASAAEMTTSLRYIQGLED